MCTVSGSCSSDEWLVEQGMRKERNVKSWQREKCPRGERGRAAGLEVQRLDMKQLTNKVNSNKVKLLFCVGPVTVKPRTCPTTQPAGQSDLRIQSHWDFICSYVPGCILVCSCICVFGMRCARTHGWRGVLTPTYPPTFLTFSPCCSAKNQTNSFFKAARRRIEAKWCSDPRAEFLCVGNSHACCWSAKKKIQNWVLLRWA